MHSQVDATSHHVWSCAYSKIGAMRGNLGLLAFNPGLRTRESGVRVWMNTGRRLNLWSISDLSTLSKMETCVFPFDGGSMLSLWISTCFRQQGYDGAFPYQLLNICHVTTKPRKFHPHERFCLQSFETWILSALFWRSQQSLHEVKRMPGSSEESVLKLHFEGRTAGNSRGFLFLECPCCYQSLVITH